MNVIAQVLVEPFEEGKLGPHVQAAIGAFERAGLIVDVGPFGNVVGGNHDDVIDAVAEAMRGAMEAGASRVTISFQVD